jgi:ABC-type transport system substrate-binding protein
MTVEYQGLLSGRYDFMSGIHAAFKDELLTPNGDLDPAFEEQIRFQKTPFIKTDYLGFLLNSTRVEAKEQAILNPVVRQAIEMAIDKVAMVKYLRNNTVMPANDGFVPPVLLGQTQSGASTYNPEKARQLLQSNGLSKDQLHISMYATGDYADLLEYIQHALAEVGITAQVVVLQSANFKEQTSKAQLPVFRKSWLADYPDAENFLAIFRSNRFAPGGPNYMHYSSEAFDALYLRAIAETNDSLRLNMYREMNAILQRDIPVIPLYYDQVSHFVGRNVRGFRTNAINMIDLSTVQKVVVQ